MALIEQGLLILLLLLDLHSRIYPTQPTMTCVCPECVCPECVVPEEKRSSRNLMQDLRSLNLQRLNVGGNDVPPTQQHSTADGRGDYDPYRTAHPPTPGNAGNVPPYATSDAFVGNTAMVSSDVPNRSAFGPFLEQVAYGGVGVLLGVGRGAFALELLQTWHSSQGLYLVDPFVHLWQVDDLSNLSDHEHQLVFENLRILLQPFDAKHVLVRDFSFSFIDTFKESLQAGGAQAPWPSFVFVDVVPEYAAVAKDLEKWRSILRDGAILAGANYSHEVRQAVDEFAARERVQVYLTSDTPPDYFMRMKLS